MKKRVSAKPASSVPDESLEQKEMRARLVMLEGELARMIEHLENLRVDLGKIQERYEREVLPVYTELDRAHEQVFSYRKIVDLMRKGYSRAQAEQLLVAHKKTGDWEEDIKEEELRRKTKQSKNEKPSDKEEIRALWRQLAFRYHPDRVGGKDEVMKKVNDAYQSGDIDTLRALAIDASIDGLPSGDFLDRRIKKIERTLGMLRFKERMYHGSIWYQIQSKVAVALHKKRDYFKLLLIDIEKELSGVLLEERDLKKQIEVLERARIKE